MDKFKINNIIDWDGIFGSKSSQASAFEPCSTGCGCETECEIDENEELRLALADAAISLSEATRTLSDLIDRIYGEV